MDLFSFDRTYAADGPVVGVDEAGRGPWAGPVVAAAVMLPEGITLPFLNDSKKCTPQRRDKLFDMIQGCALDVGVGIIGQDEIDRYNILQATYLAMAAALVRVARPFRRVLVDGSGLIPGVVSEQVAIVGGDGKSAAIAAASIIAKVTRDRIMVELSKLYPQYGFERHKGYGTEEHLQALRKFGPCPIHRRSFAPIRELMSGAGRSA